MPNSFKTTLKCQRTKSDAKSTKTLFNSNFIVALWICLRIEIISAFFSNFKVPLWICLRIEIDRQFIITLLCSSSRELRDQKTKWIKKD